MHRTFHTEMYSICILSAGRSPFTPGSRARIVATIRSAMQWMIDARGIGRQVRAFRDDIDLGKQRDGLIRGVLQIG
jgi:hypothetical protein